MAIIKHLYPGGNTCYGFYSLYDYILPSSGSHKYILKGGPGVGKSMFMKKLGKDLSEKGWDIEYHWCSSDNNSLVGIVVGKKQICFLDGTAPHVVDPRFPGAVDEIINLGQFWDRDKIKAHRENIIKLSQDISRCFERAYKRLKEIKTAFEEWKSYYEENTDSQAVNRNILALTEDFLKDAPSSAKETRHLFAGAITPGGLVSRVESIINKDYGIFAVKGSPGTGCQRLFGYCMELIEVRGLYAEVYHNPFDPEETDIIVLPESQVALMDISATVINYVDKLGSIKYKRLLDLEQFVDKSAIGTYAKLIFSAQTRFDEGINDAVSFLQTAKKHHDELEAYYINAMDFESIENLRQAMLEQVLNEL